MGNNKDNKDKNSQRLKKQLREKYMREGFDSMTKEELIQLALSYTEKADSFEAAGARLLEEYGSVSAAIDSAPLFIMHTCGLTEQSAVLLSMVRETYRIRTARGDHSMRLSDKEAASALFCGILRSFRREVFSAAALNERLWVKNVCVLTKGTDSAAEFSCREAAAFAVRNKASCLIIAHNHPHGTAEPSESDISATRRLMTVLELLDIVLIDHIIVGKESTVSMRESCKGLFDNTEVTGYRFRTDFSPQRGL